MPYRAIAPGRIAVVTGAASGIGLATARRLLGAGMRVVLADLPGERLEQAARELAAGDPGAVLAVPTDVGRAADLEALALRVLDRLGPPAVLVNNAGIQPGSSITGPIEPWEQVLRVNLWGVIHGTRAFLPAMLAADAPGLIVNTGSKQGITTPPGDPAYNIAKAGVKVFTEALEHELRGATAGRISAHLLIPGFVFTPLTARGRTEKPAGAWTPEQTVDFMMPCLERGDFYILCPDGEVDRALDVARIRWAAGDITENRPALSRWHPDFADAFRATLR